MLAAGATDEFDVDLPDGLYARRSLSRAAHDADAAASVTAALCRGVVAEREFQATVVRSRCMQ